MLYLIGLGLNEKGISQEGIEIAKRCKKIYLENYTVDFPYSLENLSDVLKKKIVSLNREQVESLDFLEYANKSDVALLVYGSPLTATTHITIINEAKKENIKCRIIYSGSVFDAVAETGLQLYKFGKIASMPKWQKSFEPDSFLEIIKENKSIKSHSLILIDIGLELKDALKQLRKSFENHNVKLGKLVLCSFLGNRKSSIFYDFAENLEEKEIRKPYCLIIPGKLHFLEKEILENYSVN